MRSNKFKKWKILILSIVCIIAAMAVFIRCFYFSIDADYTTKDAVILEETHFLPLAYKAWDRKVLTGSLEVNDYVEGFVRSGGLPWATFSLQLNSNLPDHFIRAQNIRLYDINDNLACTLKGIYEPKVIQHHSKIAPALNLFESNDNNNFFITTLSNSIEIYNTADNSCKLEPFHKLLADVDLKQYYPTGNTKYLIFTQMDTSLSLGDSIIKSTKGSLPNEWFIEVVNQGELQYVLAPSSYQADVQTVNKNYWRKDNAINTLHYRVNFLNSAPESLAFTEYMVKQQQYKNIVFVKDTTDRQDITLPSPWHLMLKHTDQLSIDDMALPSEQNRQYQEIFLPIPLSQQCEFKVIEQSDATYRLIWREGFRLSDLAYSTIVRDNFGKVRLVLTANDGDRLFFQKLTTTTQITCPKNMKWQAVNYQVTATPWLVDLSELPHMHFDDKQNALSFFGKYRFLDKEGNALMPMIKQYKLANNERDIIPQNNILLSDFLHDNKKLKFYGEVDRVEILKITDDEKITKVFSYQYIPLEYY